MGLMQKAYETYRNNFHMVGTMVEGTSPLVPVSHIIMNAHIEVTIDMDGHFDSARTVEREEQKTIIPVTEKSADRTGDNSRAHPLCDQLRYVALGCSTYPDYKKYRAKYEAYIAQLAEWANSAHSHPKVRAVLTYCRGGTMVRDLAAAGVVKCDETGRLTSGRIQGTEYPKCLVRWRIVPSPETACWEDKTLFDSFIGFIGEKRKNVSIPSDYCYVTGKYTEVAGTSPSGIIPSNFKAKLISADDKQNFTYRGRFTNPKQALAVGYEAMQEASNALRWVAANQGLVLGGRTFVCWNPKGKPLNTSLSPFAGRVRQEPEKSDYAYTMPEYREKLSRAVSGFREELSDNDDVIIAAFDASTQGRLSVTYYNELKASDFCDRLAHWQESCCWFDRRYRGCIRSPSARDIVDFAFGTEQKGSVKADDQLMKEYAQSIFHCILDAKPLPWPVVHGAAEKATECRSFQFNNRETALFVACALLRKSRNDKAKREVWSMELNKNCRDRSYLFGRLLAVAERVESATYSNEEARETNAMRMQTIFRRRPMYAWGVLAEKLEPYYRRLGPNLSGDYRKIISEICEKLPAPDDPELGKKLDDVYLLGYYHQRAAFWKSKKHPAGSDTNGSTASTADTDENGSQNN